MALQFQPPPDWLMQEYMNRKSPGQELLEGAGQITQAYLKNKQLQQQRDALSQKMALEKQQVELEKQKAEREGSQMFYEYGDQRYLPQDIQQQMNTPAQGPANMIPASYDEAQQAQMGGAQGPAMPMNKMVAPQKSSLIQHFENYLKENPFGTKGQSFTEDTVLQKDDKGNIVGQSTYKRPIKGKTMISGPGYQAQRMTTPQKTDLVDANGNPMQFTPMRGYEPAPVIGGALTPRKGDESAIGDVTLMTQQMPNIDKLIEGYKKKSILGSDRLGIAVQASPLGLGMDPELKQVERSLELAAFSFGGKNLTEQEKATVHGALLPRIGDSDASLDQKGQLLKNYFAGKIDLLQAANLLGPAGAPMRQMLQQKMGSNAPRRALQSQAPAQAPAAGEDMSHLSDEELHRIMQGG